MQEEKPWYLSKTIWASIVVVCSTLAGAVGVPVDPAAVEPLGEALLQAVSAIGGVVAILGRLAATSRIV